MPSTSQAVDKPVPVPSSRKALPGLDAARVRSRQPVCGAEAMVKPIATVSRSMAAAAAGRRSRSAMVAGDGTGECTVYQP